MEISLAGLQDTSQILVCSKFQKGSLLKIEISRLHLQSCQLGGLGWGPGIFPFNKHPGDFNVGGPLPVL